MLLLPGASRLASPVSHERPLSDLIIDHCCGYTGADRNIPPFRIFLDFVADSSRGWVTITGPSVEEYSTTMQSVQARRYLFGAPVSFGVMIVIDGYVPYPYVSRISPYFSTKISVSFGVNSSLQLATFPLRKVRDFVS